MQSLRASLPKFEKEIMAAPQVPGTPAAAPVAVPVAAPVATPQQVSDANEATAESTVEDARRAARELLFSDKPDEEAPEEGAEPEAPKVEAKPELEPEKPKEPERSEDEIALSRQWKRFRQDRKEFDAKQREFESKAKSYEEREAKIAAREARMSDPVAFLAESGWTKDKIVEFIQSDGKVDPEILVKQFSEKHQRELEELRAESAREREALKHEQNARQLATLKAKLDDYVVTAVSSEPDFKLLQRFVAKKGEAGVQTRVRDIIAKVWNEKQQTIDPRDVLVYLEAELAEIQLGDSPGQPPAVKPANAAAAEPRPITNQATSQRTVVPVDYDEDDPEARRQRAAAIWRGEAEE
jgi:hypothetical protein